MRTVSGRISRLSRAAIPMPDIEGSLMEAAAPPRPGMGMAPHPRRSATPPLHLMERGPRGVRSDSHAPCSLPPGGGVILALELRHPQREALPVVLVLVAPPAGIDFVPAHAVEVRQ